MITSFTIKPLTVTEMGGATNHFTQSYNVMATVSVPFHENQPIVLHLLQVILQKSMCWLESHITELMANLHVTFLHVLQLWKVNCERERIHFQTLGAKAQGNTEMTVCISLCLIKQSSSGLYASCIKSLSHIVGRGKIQFNKVKILMSNKWITGINYCFILCITLAFNFVYLSLLM